MAHILDPVTPLVTVKRMPPEDAVESTMQALEEGDLSSNKGKKVAKRGKKTAMYPIFIAFKLHSPSFGCPFV